MVIVLVHWKIIKDRKEEFMRYWRSGLPVNDRTGLIGEFLSQPSGHEIYDWVTMDLRGTDQFTFFANVGLWRDAETFHEQIGKYFDPTKGKLDFEFELRTRSLLTPRCWRIGDWKLPVHDSNSVL